MPKELAAPHQRDAIDGYEGHREEKTMAEGGGYDPDSYQRQVENSDAYRTNAKRLEELGTHRHHIQENPLSKTHRILLAILATALVAAAIIAISQFCISTIS